MGNMIASMGTSIGNGCRNFKVGAVSFLGSAITQTKITAICLGIPHAIGGLALGGAINFISGKSFNERTREESAPTTIVTIQGQSLKVDNPNFRHLNEINQVFMITGLALGGFAQISKLFLTERVLLNKVVEILGYGCLVGNAIITQFPSCKNIIPFIHSTAASEPVASKPRKLREASEKAVGISFIASVAQAAIYALFSKGTGSLTSTNLIKAVSYYTVCGLMLGYGVNSLYGKGFNRESKDGLNELNEVFRVTGFALGVFSQVSKFLLTDKSLLNRSLTALGCAVLLGNATISQFPNNIIPYIKAWWYDTSIQDQQSVTKEEKHLVPFIGKEKMQQASARALGILVAGIVAQVANYAAFSK